MNSVVSELFKEMTYCFLRIVSEVFTYKDNCIYKIPVACLDNKITLFINLQLALARLV